MKEDTDEGRFLMHEIRVVEYGFRRTRTFTISLDADDNPEKIDRFFSYERKSDDIDDNEENIRMFSLLDLKEGSITEEKHGMMIHGQVDSVIDEISFYLENMDEDTEEDRSISSKLRTICIKLLDRPRDQIVEGLIYESGSGADKYISLIHSILASGQTFTDDGVYLQLYQPINTIPEN